MLPRKTSNYVLLFIWVVGTVPYVVITFWLKDLPAIFPKADKVGDLIAGFSGAFSTAFPFWFVIEWFSVRKKREQLAQAQNAMIQSLVDKLNSVIQKCSKRNTGREESEMNYFEKFGPGTIIDEMEAPWKDSDGWIDISGGARLRNVTFYFDWYFMDVLAILRSFEPYLENYSIEFIHLFHDLKGKVESIDESPQGESWDFRDYQMKVMNFQIVMEAMKLMANQYRKEQGFPLLPYYS